MKAMITKNGERHGLINSVANSVKDHGGKSIDPKHKEQYLKQKEEDAKIVKARYINHRGLGERLTKPYCKYAGDSIDTWHFIPNHEYDVPKGLVDDVNKSPGLARRSDLLDANGVPTIKDGQNEKLHEFVPISF
jgi:hypothetical protein